MAYIWGYSFSAYFLFMYVLPLVMLAFTNYHLIRTINERKDFYGSKNNILQVAVPLAYIRHFLIPHSRIRG